MRLLRKQIYIIAVCNLLTDDYLCYTTYQIRSWKINCVWCYLKTNKPGCYLKVGKMVLFDMSSDPKRLPWQIVQTEISMVCHSHGNRDKNLIQCTTNPKVRPVWPAKTQISLYIHPVWQEFSFIPLWTTWRSNQPRLWRLHWCADWSESSLVAQVLLWVLLCSG